MPAAPLAIAANVVGELLERDPSTLVNPPYHDEATIVSDLTAARFQRVQIERMTRPALMKTERELLNATRRDARSLRGFEQRLWRTWKMPLELLEIQRHLALTLGAEINDELRRCSRREDQPLINVLTSLHARACQVAGEVLVLLRSGYAEGAIARWRSLHEASVVMQFVDKYGSETARRYLEHEAIESWKGAQEYTAHCDRLSFESIDEKELRQIQAAHDAAVKKYGPSFKSAYGWAAQALKLKKERVSFEDVEKGAGMEHWRPFYRLASHPIHANPKSVGHRLGLIDGAHRCLPAGPSNYGLADPGQNTGLTLAQATSVLIVRAATPDRVLAMSIMRELAAKIARTFVAVQRRIERRDAALTTGESSV